MLSFVISIEDRSPCATYFPSLSCSLSSRRTFPSPRTSRPSPSPAAVVQPMLVSGTVRHRAVRIATRSATAASETERTPEARRAGVREIVAPQAAVPHLRSLAASSIAHGCAATLGCAHPIAQNRGGIARSRKARPPGGGRLCESGSARVIWATTRGFAGLQTSRFVVPRRSLFGHVPRTRTRLPPSPARLPAAQGARAGGRCGQGISEGD